MRPVFSLSIHADYQCRHSGVCCSSDWDVPVELVVYRSLDTAIRGDRLRMAGAAASGGPALRLDGDASEDATAMVARTAEGDCVFYHRGSGLCVVHRDLGEPELPSTCRHFPRLAVRDPRGTSISLTHYCPTAAEMLFREDVGLEIVEGPAAFPPADYDGLIVKEDAGPPLLHPRMRMDVDGHAAWERHMVRRCAMEWLLPESVLASLERDARLLRGFVPGTGSLSEAVAALPPEPVAAATPITLAGSLALFAGVIAAVPEEFTPPADEEGLPAVYAHTVAPAWEDWRGPLTRYLAAKAFASWTAYQGRGVLTVVRGLDAALALVRVEATRQCRDAGRALDANLMREAFRSADFLLNHLAIGEDLAESWSTVEGPET